MSIPHLRLFHRIIPFLRSVIPSTYLNVLCTPLTNYMLISQPSIMWHHGGFWSVMLGFCNWLSVLFPKLLVLTLMSWSLWVAVVELTDGSYNQWYLHLMVAVVAATYVLAMYTYFKVIWVGAGSPLDFVELTGDARDARSLFPSGDPYHHPGLNRLVFLARLEQSPDEGIDANAGDSLLAPVRSARTPPQEYFSTHTFKNNAPAYRWCSSCGVWKPDRCHHCATCRRCFLRMDHHCPWFACCVGFRNHKFFIQSLVYISVYCGLTFAVSGIKVWQFFARQTYENTYLSLNLVFLLVVSFAFFVAEGSFAAFLVYMVLTNTTTIEFQDLRWQYLEILNAAYEFDSNGKKRALGHIYDLGWRRNWKAVMGPSWVSWLLPITSTSDELTGSLNNGVNFEVNEDLFDKYCQNARLQEQLNHQLAEYRNRIRGTDS